MLRSIRDGPREEEARRAALHRARAPESRDSGGPLERGARPRRGSLPVPHRRRRHSSTIRVRAPPERGAKPSCAPTAVRSAILLRDADTVTLRPRRPDLINATDRSSRSTDSRRRARRSSSSSDRLRASHRANVVMRIGLVSSRARTRSPSSRWARASISSTTPTSWSTATTSRSSANLKASGPFHPKDAVPSAPTWNADGHSVIPVTRDEIAGLVQRGRRFLVF